MSLPQRTSPLLGSTSPLPELIREAFRLAQPDGRLDGSRFYGPYNMLLNYLFPMEGSYMVSPQSNFPGQSKSTNSTMTFIVTHNGHPVLFVEVRPSSHVDRVSSRESADKQMRKRFKDLVADTQVPKLYGMSVLGTRVCFYSYRKEGVAGYGGGIFPRTLQGDKDMATDTAPAGRWQTDVLDPDGIKTLGNIVGHIHDMLTQLQRES